MERSPQGWSGSAPEALAWAGAPAQHALRNRACFESIRKRVREPLLAGINGADEHALQDIITHSTTGKQRLVRYPEACARAAAVRADRLAASIGPDVYAWWLYPDEAFDSKQAAALALVDILDPAGPRRKPIHTMLVLEQELGATLARLQPTQRAAMAAAIGFFVNRILLPFAETSSFERWQAVNRNEGKPWIGEDFDDGIELLKTLQALLEGKGDTSIIIIGAEPGAHPGGDCGDRADCAD